MINKIALTICIALLAFTGRADTIYSNLSPGSPAYSASAAFSYDVPFAVQFTAGATGNLAMAEFGITHFGLPSLFSAYLYSDSSNLPGSNLGFLGSGTPTAAFGSTGDSLVSINLSTPISMTMGTTYWLVVDGLTFNGWNLNNTGVMGNGSRFSNGSWEPLGSSLLPAFRLTAAPAAVPESGGTASLFAASIAALCVFARGVAKRQSCH